VDDRTQAEILNRLGLSARLARGKIACVIPPHRPDLTREVDLIEEVARLHGYDKIPVHEKITHRVMPVQPGERAISEARDVLSAAGFDEAVTFSFVDDEEAALMGFETGVRVDPRTRRTNNLLRPTAICSLLRACKANQDVGNDQVSLYELAAAFQAGPAAALPEEHVELAMVTDRDVQHLRGTLEAVAARVAPSAKLQVVPEAVPALAEGAAAAVELDGQRVGRLGLVDAKVLDFYGLTRPYAAASIRFDALMARAGQAKSYKSLPRFPPVHRDLSLVVDEAVTWQQLAETIGSTDQPALEALEYVGTYRGRQIPRGKKSVTLSLTYRGASGTLRGQEVDEMVARAVGALGEALGAKVRQ